jgi:excisionase family DNA binding protein
VADRHEAAAGVHPDAEAGGLMVEVPRECTVTEAARILGKDRSTVRKWCIAGRIPSFKVGGMWHIDVTEGRTVPMSSRGQHPTTGRLR